jgi:hypothetical protein
MSRQHLIPVPDRRRIGLEEQAVALHLDCGIWRASCVGCGFELAEGRRQDRVERKAARRSCPICVGRSPDPGRAAGGPVESQSRSD